jgi:hypothetical protein
MIDIDIISLSNLNLKDVKLLFICFRSKFACTRESSECPSKRNLNTDFHQTSTLDQKVGM